MSDKKRTYQAETLIASSLELRASLGLDDETGVKPRRKAGKRRHTYSREVIERLIERLKTL